MGGGWEQGIVVVETWLWESLKPSWLKGTLRHLFLSGPGTEGMAGTGASSLVV